MNLNVRISALREKMAEQEIDIYLITTEDAYLAESAVDYWRSLQWLTGFSGTLAYALVSQNHVTFWTDARYRIQAKQQVDIVDIEHFDVTEVGADYYLEWIEEEISAIPKDNVVLGVDGRTITAARGLLIKDKLEMIEDKNVSFIDTIDLVGDVWQNRPEPIYKPIFEHKLKYTGFNRKEKLQALRRELKNHGADHTIVGTMEGVVWLTNLRGQDIVNPLFMSHVLVKPDTALLFARLEAIDDTLKEELIADGYTLCEIEKVNNEINKISEKAIVFYDKYRINYQLYSSIPENIKKIQGFDLVNNLKAIKNDTELKNFSHVNILESVALFKFFLHVKQNVDKGHLNEYNLASILHEIRSESPEYFAKEVPPLMAAYMQNAAGPHYFPTEDKNETLKASGVLLVDDVCHYYGGTIDITRTVYLGPCPEIEDIKRDYTLTLRSLMDLIRQIFREGADGAYLDSVARRVMWNECLHYGYGTGHGIGYCIVPHEGPQFISEPSYKKEWAFSFVPLKPRMVLAVEPGVYREEKYGIRLEDNVYIKEKCTNEYGTFYSFEDMTCMPFERELIDCKMLHEDEILWLNKFHENAFDKLAPYMSEEELSELEKATAPLT